MGDELKLMEKKGRKLISASYNSYAKINHLIYV